MSRPIKAAIRVGKHKNREYLTKVKKLKLTFSSFKIRIHIMPGKAPIGVK